MSDPMSQDEFLQAVALDDFKRAMKSVTHNTFESYEARNSSSWFANVLNSIRMVANQDPISKEEWDAMSEEEREAEQERRKAMGRSVEEGVVAGFDSKEDETLKVDFTGDYDFTQLKEDYGFFQGAVVTSLDLFGKAASVASKYQGYISSIAEPHREEMVKLKESYGGIAQLGSEMSNDIGTAMADSYVKFAKDFGKTTEQLKEEGRDLLVFEPTIDLEGLDGVTSELQLMFEDPKFAFKNFGEIISSTARTYGSEIAESFKDSTIELGVISKGLGLSSKQLERVITRSIDRTGEANIDTLMNFNKFAQGVAAATGKSAKIVADTMTAVISDVQNFGNVTDEEASRISAALLEIGIAADTLGKLVGKFANFDSAASAVGNLTAAFGLNLDAMEMMMLANEDQEQFLFRMRDAFEEQGLNFQEMSLAQQKLISSQVGLSVEEASRFFDFENEITSLEELKESTEEMSPEDSVKALQSELVSLIDKGGDVRKALEKTKAFGLGSDVVDNAIKAERNVSKLLGTVGRLEGAMQKKISTEVINSIDKATGSAYDIMDKLNKAIENSKKQIREQKGTKVEVDENLERRKGELQGEAFNSVTNEKTIRLTVKDETTNGVNVDDTGTLLGKQ